MPNPHNPAMIRVSGDDRRRLRFPWWSLVRNKLREVIVKARGERISGQGMIGADAEAVKEGFADLSDEQFAEYNFPQRWVERRTIPVAIDGRVPARGAVVLDLGCGPGTSTEVLTHFAHTSWKIIAYDLTPRSIELARERAARGGFVNRDGASIVPEFHCQDIGGTLRRDGEALPAGVADMAVSGGVVGLYMNPRSVTRLAWELRRVLKPGGFAALDAGPAVGVRVLKEIMARAGFRYVRACRSAPFDPRPKLVFERGEILEPRANQMVEMTGMTGMTNMTSGLGGGVLAPVSSSQTRSTASSEQRD